VSIVLWSGPSFWPTRPSVSIGGLTIDDFIVSDDAMVRSRSILLMLALAAPSASVGGDDELR